MDLTEASAYLEQLIQSGSYPAIALIALLEATPPLGYWFPGSRLIILSTVVARQGTLWYPGVIAAITIGFFVAYHICFLAGRSGSWIVRNRQVSNLLTHPPKLLRSRAGSYLAYIHPSTGALQALLCGVRRDSYLTFLGRMLPSLLVWNTLWGLVSYGGAGIILTYLAAPVALAAIVLVLSLTTIVTLIKKRTSRVVETAK